MSDLDPLDAAFGRYIAARDEALRKLMDEIRNENTRLREALERANQQTVELTPPTPEEQEYLDGLQKVVNQQPARD